MRLECRVEAGAVEGVVRGAEGADAAQRVLDDEVARGEDVSEAQAVRVAGDGAKEMGGAEAGGEGGGACRGGKLGMVDDDEVVFGQVVDAECGAVGDVAQEAKVDDEGASVGEGGADPRGAVVGETFADAGAEGDGVVGVGRGEEDAGVVVMRGVGCGGGGGGVGVGVEDVGLETGGGEVAEEGGLREGGVGERGDVDGLVGEEKVEDGFGAAEVEILVEQERDLGRGGLLTREEGVRVE